MKRISLILSFLLCCVFGAQAAKVNAEKTIKVNGVSRKYILYVPDRITSSTPLVFSLHGAGGHDTDRSPFGTDVADKNGCIVVYPQGANQYFAIFGGSTPGWNSTGEANEDLDFFKAIIEEVVAAYPSIDRKRIYCCGFSNGGMMTYSNATSAADIFAAFASISGFQLNEFHHRPTGVRPVPFLHIHGKADDFVKYSCMPIIRDNMVARNGCNPVPVVTKVSGKYTKSVYEAGEGGFPYIYYEIDGMGHSPYTANTEDGNSSVTMWKFMSKYRLDDPCDSTLKWRLNVDTDGFDPKAHNWTTNSAKTSLVYGKAKAANNADNNVYPSLQFEAGDYKLRCEVAGANAGDSVTVRVQALSGTKTLFSCTCRVGEKIVVPFTVDKYAEYKMTIKKSSADVKFVNFAFHAASADDDDDQPGNTDTGVQSASSAVPTPVAYYSLSGTRMASPSHGINIVKMSDGNYKKVVR